MKANEIQVGHTYIIRHHYGNLCKVRVDRIYAAGLHNKLQYFCTKLLTDRIIIVESAAKFRREATENDK